MLVFYIWDFFGCVCVCVYVLLTYKRGKCFNNGTILLNAFMVFVVILFFETGFLYVALGILDCPRTLSVDQAGLELTEICWPLFPKC